MTGFFKKEGGQTLGEFVLIFLLVVIVVIAALTLFGNRVLQLWNQISNAF